MRENDIPASGNFSSFLSEFYARFTITVHEHRSIPGRANHGISIQ